MGSCVANRQACTHANLWWLNKPVSLSPCLLLACLPPFFNRGRQPHRYGTQAEALLDGALLCWPLGEHSWRFWPSLPLEKLLPLLFGARGIRRGPLGAEARYVLCSAVSTVPIQGEKVVWPPEVLLEAQRMCKQEVPIWAAFSSCFSSASHR